MPPPPADAHDAASALLARLAELEAELATLNARPSEPGAQVQYGKRAGDHIAQVTDQLTRARAAEQVEMLVEQVRAALLRIEEGAYGLCEACGRPIPEGRLAALPWATRCVDCAGAAGGARAASR
ncbi:MAG: TraR/DksA family transcriptional regulator [Candidatus Dormibacteria bacterium]